MSTRVTVASIAGCVFDEQCGRVILSIANRRGQAVELTFAPADFVGLMPVLLATAAAVSQRGSPTDASSSNEQVRQSAAPVTELAI